MKTTTTTFIIALAVTLGLLISVPPADANKPLDVNCDLLEATNDAVDEFLDAGHRRHQRQRPGHGIHLQRHQLRHLGAQVRAVGPSSPDPENAAA